MPISCALVRFRNKTAEALVNEARAIGVDLMVTGAFGHIRFFEWVTGGTTRELLTTVRFLC